MHSKIHRKKSVEAKWNIFPLISLHCNYQMSLRRVRKEKKSKTRRRYRRLLDETEKEKQKLRELNFVFSARRRKKPT
jgi:hypothetical protein